MSDLKLEAQSKIPDVEVLQNKSKVLDVDTHLMAIKEAIWDARSQWRDIGRKLGLREGDIQAIHEPRDGECLHEVLAHWIHTGRAVISDLLTALESPTIGHSDIAKEIQSRRGENRTEVGLSESCDGETVPVDKMTLLWSTMPELTLEELCALPVEKPWYQLGLWLGVDESELQEIKRENSRHIHSRSKDMESPSDSDEEDNDSNHTGVFNERKFYQKVKKGMFASFLDSSFNIVKCRNFIRKQPAECRETFIRFFQDSDRTMSQKCKKQIENIKDSKAKAIGQELFVSKLSKRERMIDALIKVGLCQEAEILLPKEISLTTYLHLTDPASEPPDYVLQYASHLKKIYKEMSVIPDDWPPSTTTDQRYSKLALIRSKRIDQCTIRSTEKDYLHGNVDRIVAQKESITLNEMFYPIINKSTNTSRLTILMDGAPGVGKTTIARKVCIDWANGDLLQEYQLVVYVPLREAVGDSVASLLPPPIKIADKVAEYLDQLTILGKSTLFIFDGFDELSLKDRSRKSLFIRIIKGDILPDCSVLVASRPYASSKALSSLSRINRHVEVLGFSKSEIKRYIKKDLPKKKEAQSLIKMLKERIDIFSLCYIPLNCKIVLFVFKQQQYQLPTTLTELYETFILHTIKRSVEKNDETDLECNVASIDALDPELLTNLNNLCKVAFDCLHNDKLFLEMKDLKNSKQTLLLGLLNCLRTINSRCLPEEHYQFLHLTIQEFLAARFLVSDKYTGDRHKFLLEHINDVRYRMTLLFFAGLTKLDFIPSNTSLLGDQTIDLVEPLPVPQNLTEPMTVPQDLTKSESFIKHTATTSPLNSEPGPSSPKEADIGLLPKPNVEQKVPILKNSTPKKFKSYSRSQQAAKRKDQEKLMLVAHLLFEGQIKCLSTPLAIRSDTLIFSADWLSPFDQLALGYFFSSTPQTHVWNVIDLSKCALPSDSVLYTTPLSSNSKIIAIGMTKCLSLTDVTISTLVRIINTNFTLKELHLNISQNKSYLFITSKHEEVNLICTAISECNTLQTVRISKSTHVILILEKKFIVKEIPGMCSNSLIKLLDFVKRDSLECIEITSSKAFQDCTSCQSLGSQAVDSLRRVLEKSRNVKEVDLSDCDLQTEVVHTFVTILLSSENPTKLNLNGNYLLKGFIEELLIDKLLVKGMELEFLGMCLQPNGTCLQITGRKTDQLVLESFFQYCRFPTCFDSIDVHINLSHQTVSSFLKNNQHLCQVTFPENYIASSEQEPNCQRTLMMIKAITNHDNLQLFSGLNFKVSSQIFHIKSSGHVCIFSTETLLKFFDPKVVKEVCIDGCPKAFQGCSQSTSELAVTMVIKTMCEMIKASERLRSIAFQHCELNEHYIETIVSSLKKSPSEHLEEILLSGNELNSKSITTLLQIFTSKQIKVLEIFHCLININNDQLTLKCTKPSERVNYFLENLSCPNEIKHLTVLFGESDESSLIILDLEVLAYLLLANPNLVEINLELMESNQQPTCKRSLAFAKALSAHPSMQNVSIHVCIYYRTSIITISKQALIIGDLILCPKTLTSLLAYVTPEEVEVINLSGNFRNCLCKSKGDLVQQSLIECLAKCVNLKRLYLSNIPEGMIERLVNSISRSEQLQLLNIPSCCPTADSLAKVLRLTSFSLTELHVSNFTVTAHSRTTLIIERRKLLSGYSTYFNTILQSLARKLDCQLKILHVHKNIALEDYHARGFKLFLGYGECTINCLILSKNKVSFLFMKNFVHCMKTNTFLEELHLSSLQLSGKTVTLLLKAIVTNKTLKHLDLSSNNLTLDCEPQVGAPDHLGMALQELLENNQCLSVLNLRKCHLSLSVIHHIEIGLTSNTTLTHLNLSFHSFLSKSDGKIFGRSIETILTKNQSLQVLLLMYCKFTEVVMSCIARALTTNSTLKELYLDSALIRKQMPYTFSSLETAKTREWLTLFSALKRSSSLHTLSVRMNRFDEEEFSALKDLLRHNKTVNSLKVVGCGFSDTQLSELQKELPTKHSLVALKEHLLKDPQQKSMYIL